MIVLFSKPRGVMDCTPAWGYGLTDNHLKARAGGACPNDMNSHSRGPGNRSKAAVCGVLLVLSAPWSASWAAAKERDNPYIAKATQLREKFKYNDALQMLEKAAKWPSNTPEQVVTISLLEGVLRYETAQRPELAEQCFERALTLSPDAQIPLDVSPKITDQLEKVRTRVKAALAAKSPPPPDKPAEVPMLGVSSQGSLGDRLSPYRVPVAIAGGGVAVVGVLSWVRAKS